MKTQDIKNNPEEKKVNLPNNQIPEPNNFEEEKDAQDKGQDTLNQMASTKEQLARIKEDLDKMIDAFAQNKSILSRAAKFWGELPWWQKVIAGSIIIVPLLVVSIVTHLLILTVISLFTLFAYVGSSLLLDNHHKQSQNDKDDLKKGILSLADTLGTVIESLDQLRQDLANEITKFQTENKHLTGLVEELSQQVEQLKAQVSHLVNLEQELEITKEALQRTSTNFSNAVEDHKKLLERNKFQLEKTIKDYEGSQAQLSAKILELNDVKNKMGEELEQAKIVSQILQTTVDELSASSFDDEAQKSEFQERLKEFFKDRSKSFDYIVDSTKELKNKLHAVEEELKSSNKRYAELLERAGGQIDRLEKTFNLPSPSISPTATLKKVGFYAIENRNKPEDLPNIVSSTSYGN